ncbi:MAG: hypothetical protein FWE04_02270 [Oscillospiraceae bacterium]|nr:hypothetical protein [Oscillospiraceae bacterium]
MRKLISIILAVIMLSLLVTGCVNTADEPENYIPEVVTEDDPTPEPWPEIISPTDYSVFLGDWYNYFAAGTTILQISEIDENEIIFNMIFLGGEDENPINRVGPYTLPIVDNQVHFERSRITSEDEWWKSHNTLVFSGDDIFWVTESSSSWAMPDGTFETHESTLGIHNGEFEIQFRSLQPILDGGYWQPWLGELLN